MNITKLLCLVLIIALSFKALCYWHIFHKDRTQLVYVYDNTEIGGGDKVAQERLIREFKKQGVEVELITDFLDNNIYKLIDKIFNNKKYFSFIQSFIVNNKSHILTPYLNNNLKYFVLLYAIEDIAADNRSNSNQEICSYYYKNSHHYNKGRLPVGLLVTTGKKIDISCKNSDLQIEFLMSWYPTVNRNEFAETAPIKNKIFYTIGGGWDSLRKSQKYIGFLKELAAKGDIDIYGPETLGLNDSSIKLFGSGYKGFIDNANNFIAKNQDYAASLILHSEHHLKNKIPSGRIFEAMAAGRVIISDRNKWVVDNLKDNVLYVDSLNLPQEDIVNAIHNHLEWIKAHPGEAKKMAKNVHDIFVRKFSLEDQVGKIISKVK